MSLSIEIAPGNNMYEVNYLLIFWKSKEHKEDEMELQKKKWHEGQDFTTRECNFTTKFDIFCS